MEPTRKGAGMADVQGGRVAGTSKRERALVTPPRGCGAQPHNTHRRSLPPCYPASARGVSHTSFARRAGLTHMSLLSRVAVQ